MGQLVLPSLRNRNFKKWQSQRLEGHHQSTNMCKVGVPNEDGQRGAEIYEFFHQEISAIGNIEGNSWGWKDTRQ